MKPVSTHESVLLRFSQPAVPEIHADVLSKYESGYPWQHLS